MRAVVVSFDHLPVGFLGCHGNTWVDTPNLDRLAADAVLFDGHFAECLGATASHAWWTGCRQLPAHDGTSRGGDVIGQLRSAGARTTLLVEEPNGRPVATPETFDEVVPVDGRDGLDVDASETPFARLVAEAIRRIEDSADEDVLLWLKSRGVPSPWLPPRDFAERYVALFEDLEDESETASGATDDDEFEWIALEETFEDDSEGLDGDPDAEFDEPEVEEAVEEGELDEQEELDALLEALAAVGERENNDALDTSDWLLVRAVYGGYVALLDRSIGRLRSAIRERWGDDVLLIVTAAEGELLGERVGFPAEPDRVGEERVHTPLIVSVEGTRAGMRRPDLVQPMDVAATLLDWFRLGGAIPACEGVSLLPGVRGGHVVDDEAGRTIVYGFRSTNVPTAAAIRNRSQVLTTNDADAVGEADPRGDDVQLFVKPGDVWEVHDVSNQSPGEVRELAASLADFLTRARSMCPADLAGSE